MVGWHHWFNGHEFWVNSGSWWWIGRPGLLRSMGVTKSRTQLSDWITIPVMVLSLENRVFVDNQVKMTSLRWNQMQCDRCLCRKEKFWHRDRQSFASLAFPAKEGRWWEDTWRISLQAKDQLRLLEVKHGTDSYSQPSEEINLSCTCISDFQSPVCETTNFYC